MAAEVLKTALLAVGRAVLVVCQHLVQSIPVLGSGTPSSKMYVTAHNHHGDHKDISYIR
jgi:hypothetical protein